jgi:peptide/nickel transport system ATP-binding protein
MMVTSVRTNTLLEIKHLSVDYASARGTVHAVNDVSFTIERGQIFGLAGESGSGKSTLAYALARLLQPPAVVTQGQVLYYPKTREDYQTSRLSQAHSSSSDDAKLSLESVALGLQEKGGEIPNDDGAIDVLALNAAQLRAFRWRDLSIVFQSAMNALNPVLNIGTQITDVLHAHNPLMTAAGARARAVELLRLVGITPDRLQSYPHELSGGMRQRAMIAIALALNAEMIIMDEPTTALDVVVQRDILAQIMRLRNDFGFSVIFITHDLSLLLEISDTIAIMYAGRMVEMGTQKDLLRSPRHPYTCGLLNSFPTLHGPRRPLSGITGSPPDLREVPSGCAFHPRCARAFAPCHTIVPTLRPVVSEGSSVEGSRPLSGGQGSCVACHLYDADLSPEGPPQSLESEHVN